MSRSRQDKIRLGVFLYPTGHHVAGWRHPEAAADAGTNFRHYVELAQTAERGKFDLLFLSDSSALRGAEHLESLSRIASRSVFLEPLTLLPALAAVTSHIGLVATATSTYNEPYALARKFATLDHISGGRAGWNLITSNNEAEAQNFSRDKHPEHADRYDRAQEFAAVVARLWDSWDDDAFLRDKSSGVFFDQDKLHFLNHRGEHFSVKGPLNVARPPQGHPVQVQAGASEAGRDLAAQFAEVVFTAQSSIAGARDFYADVKSRAAAYDRAPEDIKIMPGFSTVVGASATEAAEKHAQLQELLDPVVGLSLLSAMLGNVDLSGADIDGPLPELPATNAGKGRQALLVEAARRDKLTIRDLYKQVAGARGHHAVHGTASQIADELESWFLEEAADGFNIMPAVLPAGLNDFVDHVVPELQRRGLFRREYEGRTLRDNLGLKRPQSYFASKPGKTD
ncbi:LLM class flavin-dependent oxidoreductase [Uliginosibacterium sp. H3]|uniref:LLM class flavin-dependent oxidoreductase n=1 Tax=Uliginosibacterium silvisoli TaxID=3114758 RepID=A0ABU6K3R2_9RHOO|nr:LLM class flavin-dependent oxidoreductase [Uliginosibacterium sp. H3]